MKILFKNANMISKTGESLSGVDICIDGEYILSAEKNKTPENFERTRLWANGVVDFIDEILGIGSVNKIAKGGPVKAELAVEWLAVICTAIGEDAKEKAAKKADEHIEEKYE